MNITGTELLQESYYMRVYHPNGVDFKNVKCKIVELGIEKNKEGRLDCIATLSPLEDLPEWYDMEDYIEDFELPISYLVDNEFWLSTYF